MVCCCLLYFFCYAVRNNVCDLVIIYYDVKNKIDIIMKVFYFATCSYIILLLVVFCYFVVARL